ncbi:LysR family transcriptional regulator [Paraburkholderia sp. Ac-20336]|uniref:LysR family transcriptional regulator n=1 Tax=unclassified Paraburkholderia TaxID=2615204 RepID=UPI00197EB987|nr:MULTISPECIES: LysR family transcriptional regulator [unclassified Paraburkholderia]MBN3803544.1 LysR family transcriptional regulator [Paraburkholderia sp. Ac-20336]MBN3849667.1 LysR family transcriptional regulator [Paraburkholderia sp. Ac-20342]
MQSLPDLEAWAIFARVASTGSFAKAAETLGMSQPTVSKAVIRLEKRLGATLLYRTSRRISLTPTGLSVMERAKHIVREFESIEAETSAHARAPKGLLRISAPMSFGLKYVAPLIPGFLARYPEVKIEVSFDDAVVDIVGGGFDVAIRIAEPEDASMRARNLYLMRRILVASPAYLAQHGPIDHPREIGAHACLCYASHSTSLSWRFQHASGEECSVTIDGRMRTNNAESLIPALLAGMGIALQPEFVVADALRHGELVELLPEWKIAQVYLSLVTPSQVIRSARVAALLDYLSQSLLSTP